MTFDEIEIGDILSSREISLGSSRIAFDWLVVGYGTSTRNGEKVLKTHYRYKGESDWKKGGIDFNTYSVKQTDVLKGVREYNPEQTGDRDDDI